MAHLRAGLLASMLLVAGLSAAQAFETSDYLVPEITAAQVDADHQQIKQRYIQYLIGTEQSFDGTHGAAAAQGFIGRLSRPIRDALAFDFSKDAGETFHLFQDDSNLREESSVYSALLERFVLSLAYGYTVDAPNSPYYQSSEILECYLQCLDYLYGRGVRDGMTFHNNELRMNMTGAPRPEGGAGNLVKMELRMGALCQSLLLMEPYIQETEQFTRMRALVRQLEMLGHTSGHVRYYDPYISPEPFEYRVQCDAIQNYTDTTLVSALLETDADRRAELLLDARRVFTDSLKVIPGWADTIKPDFTGFHHRGIYGSAYTGGFIPQAAVGVYVLDGTHYEVEAESIENLKRLIETYRLYCQKYAMPFGIRGRMPLNTHSIKAQVMSGILLLASPSGLNDSDMKPIFKRLWDFDYMGFDFLFSGGRGKILRGMYGLNLLDQLQAESIEAEADPSGYWYKPYGGLAIHRRDHWMVAVKGYSKYIWDYENGQPQNVYGQYVSHGSLTLFTQGDPVGDIASGYNLEHGWDWYRMPGTTAVHFPIEPQVPLEHREFSPETFLGGASMDGQDGVFGMALNQETFPDGTDINLKAHKSVFFMDNLIVLLGSDISGGDGEHAVETTLFQSFLPAGSDFEWVDGQLVDPAGNHYFVADASKLKRFKGHQDSYKENGKDPSSGDYAVAWFDHGLNPEAGSYEAAIVIGGGVKPAYRVIRKDRDLHQVYFEEKHLIGYVFFTSEAEGDPVIASVDQPCLAMVKIDGGAMQLSVANPDLGLLPEDAEPPTFRFISRDQNLYLPSQLRPVELTLHGQWKLQQPNEQVEVVSSGSSGTVLRFACLDGMDIQVGLIKE